MLEKADIDKPLTIHQLRLDILLPAEH